MLKIDVDDRTIHLTRGDRCSFKVYCIDPKSQEKYTFPAGCTVSFAVVNKQAYTKGELMRKTVNVTEDTEEVEFTLTEEDTKIGDMIDKKQKFWYNVVVNDDITIIGSDEDGEKLFILYPEVGENGE